MSFHEKGAWACLISILAVYVPYFLNVLREPMAGLGLFFAAAMGLALLLTVFHIVNALATRTTLRAGAPPPADELDRAIETAAARWAGLVLAVAVMVWILAAMLAIPVFGRDGVEIAAATVAVHWLFAGFVLANLAYYAGIVIGYRRLSIG